MPLGTNFECGFCSKGQGEVRWLIAGPTVHICDSCARGVAAAIIGDIAAAASSIKAVDEQTACCSFCRKGRSAVQAMSESVVRGISHICNECSALCQEMLAEAEKGEE